MGGVPSQILPNLWLGGQDVLNNPSFFEKQDVTYVLSLGPNAPDARIKLVSRCQINLPDVPGADLGRHFAKIVRFIAEGRHSAKGCVYVHCAAGISRSTTAVCAYLMAHLDLSFDEVLTFVASKRKAVCPNEGFSRQLRTFEHSREREALAAELHMMKDSEALRKRDMAEVQKASMSRTGPLLEVKRGIRFESGAASWEVAEDQARHKALEAIQDASKDKGCLTRLHRIGDGASNGNLGLGWLLEPQTANLPQRSSHESEPSKYGSKPCRLPSTTQQVVRGTAWTGQQRPSSVIRRQTWQGKTHF